MTSRDEGIAAIIALQKLAGVDEPKARAAKSWDNFSEEEKQKTMLAFMTFVPVIKPMTVVRQPVGVNCGSGSGRVVGSIPPAKGGGKCSGLMRRIDLSRLEEGLGHEGYECDKCGRRLKYIGPAEPVAARERVVPKESVVDPPARRRRRLGTRA